MTFKLNIPMDSIPVTISVSSDGMMHIDKADIESDTPIYLTLRQTRRISAAWDRIPDPRPHELIGRHSQWSRRNCHHSESSLTPSPSKP